jgi:L-seryl-tRNA(Ser) seleniumtransferase
MKRHPLLRALRMDKLNLAALEATLRLYRDQRRALSSIPVLRMLTMTADHLAQRAGLIARKLRKSIPDSVTLIMHPGESSAGGGSFPLLQLPTTLIEVCIAGLAPHRIEELLRRSTVPVIGRIHRGRFLLDVRTILDDDIKHLAHSLICSAQS